MIDWNKDGKIDEEDWMLTEIILDEAECDSEELSDRSGGGCLSCILLFIVIPISFIALLLF